MILVDTSVWIDYFNGKINPHTDYLDGLLGNQVLFIGDLIYTEILQGFRSETDFKTAKSLLDSLLFRNLAGKLIAERSASNYRILRKKGITVRKTIDIIIGTYCLEHSHSLLHLDADFNALESHLNLKVIHP